jgi:hypothetical protein
MIKELAKEINEKWFKNNKNYIGFYDCETILALLTKKDTLSEIETALKNIILDNTFFYEDEFNNIKFDVSDNYITVTLYHIDYYFRIEEKFIY